ncbi:ankyrin repeat domain-containing protein SOWAHA isoform X2 [Stegostoma tigrinum]|uniref:ankyrin repeat domain-containing protein SOWAHA isoform X2 n=1 Tax=Stegostoma tigrinum TaxID=3053191 RepID=UPI0028702D3E|nr:ankyrin repeat domain-containing protein SOWAHA isoform X2 [Stegostoma tigrinum]
MAECGSKDLREDALIDFLAKKGGRVKNKELVERFKKFINAPEPQLKAKYRDIFKDIVNKIALVKQEDNGIHVMCKARKTQGEKYVVLKKKYQRLVRERDGYHKEENITMSTPAEEFVEQLRKEELSPHSEEEKQQNSNSDAPKSKKTFTMETLLKIDISEPTSSKISAGSSTEEKVNMCEWLVQELPPPAADTKIKVPSELARQSQERPSICFSEAFGGKQGKRLDTASESVTECPVQIEVKVEEPQTDGFDAVFKDDSVQNGFEDGTGSMGSPSVALDPLEKEWLKCAASGQLTALCDLLRQDPSLATKKVNRK